MSNSSFAGAREQAGPDRLTVLASAMKRACVAGIMWRMERSAINVLRSMSDSDLNDFGLSRSDIADTVCESGAGDCPLGISRGCAGCPKASDMSITSLHTSVHSY